MICLHHQHQQRNRPSRALQALGVIFTMPDSRQMNARWLDIQLVNFLGKARLVQKHLQALEHHIFQTMDTVLMKLSSQSLRHLGERDGVADVHKIDGVVPAAPSFGSAHLALHIQGQEVWVVEGARAGTA